MPAKPSQTVYHVETLKADAAARRIYHARGAVRSPITNAGHEINPAAAQRGCVDLGSATADEIANDKKLRAEWVNSGRSGPKPEPYVEMIFAGPPQYNDIARRWDEAKETKWAEATHKWVQSRFPDSLIVVSSLHRDETAPHIHVIASPRSVDGVGEISYGWCRARNETVLRHTAAARRNKKPKGDRAGRTGRRNTGQVLSALQTDYHRSVGAKFGLTRGKIGSKAQHQAVDELKAAKGHIQEATNEIRQVGAKLKAARRQAALHAKRLAIRERTLTEREEAHGTIDEREDQLVAQTQEVTQAATELAALQDKIRTWGQSLERRERTLQRRRESTAAAEAELAEKRQRLDQDIAATAVKAKRIDAAMLCLSEATATIQADDMHMWQDHAHEALHGDLASIERIFAVAAKMTEHERQHKLVQRRRRRRRNKGDNVVDFRRSG